MNYSAKCNIYEYSLATTWERFADRLSGSYGALFCVVSERPLPPQAQQALASSAKALGYGTEPCTFVTLCAGTAAPDAGMAGQPEAPDTGVDSRALDADSLLRLIEGLDPNVIVAADAAAARALGTAYRAEVPPSGIARLLGRSTVAFRSFPDMLGSQDGKQKAWALLKRLPAFGTLG